MNGTDLLADFRDSRSEGAFSELVRRYTNLVYSVAKRRLSKTKLLAGLAAAVLVGVTTFMLLRSPPRAGQATITGASQSAATKAEQSQAAATSATPDTNAADGQREPDPLKLLLAVAQARQRIVSGSLEFQVALEHFGTGQRETNHIRLAALFDGPKLRYEQFGREYSYTYSAEEAEQDDIKKRADAMDREAAVRAGLLKPFESHHTMAYDGAVLLNYWETDGKPFAFIGVFGDDDLTRAKADVEKYGITWPSFRDKRDGPISTNWNVRSWPNIWVLDPQGVIRYRGVRGRELIEAVNTLLRE